MSNPCGTAVSLADARTIVVRAPAHARSSDFPPMTVAVLDAAGRLLAFAGEDVSSLRERIARASAAGALNVGVGSGSLATRAEARPAFINSAVALAAGELVPVAGGVLVRDDDVVGAVGVSGQLTDGDEACGLRGIARRGCGPTRNLPQPSRLMSKQTAMSRIFGKIAQIGYVVRDIDASIDQWVRRGVGPWFDVDRVQTDYFLYRGVESELEVNVAVANSGELQRELIQPRNDASSAFTEFLDAGHDGAQHVAYWTEDFQQLYDNALSLGYTVTREGSIGGEHGRFAYLDTEHDHGTAIEISDIGGPTGPFFSDIRDAAANWDGTDPIRRRR
jgi:uncharacterized protein GlcG (DUF336 family)